MWVTRIIEVDKDEFEKIIPGDFVDVQIRLERDEEWRRADVTFGDKARVLRKTQVWDDWGNTLPTKYQVVVGFSDD